MALLIFNGSCSIVLSASLWDCFIHFKSLALSLFQKAYVIHWVNVDRHESIEEVYEYGRSRLNLLLSKVHNSNV
jgi:hypothetical protein